MKRLLITLFVSLFCGVLYAQNEIGIWETYDNKRDKPMSHVQIYQQNGKLYGKVVKVLDESYKTCTRCSGENKNKPVVGLMVIRGLEKKGSKWEKDDGILDPVSGLIIDGQLWMDGSDKLKVKGTWGFISDTQTWKRVVDNKK